MNMHFKNRRPFRFPVLSNYDSRQLENDIMLATYFHSKFTLGHQQPQWRI